MIIKILKNKIRNIIYSKRTGVKFNNSTNFIFKINELKYYLKSFGNLNKNKIFYIIQRSPGGGLFSNLNYVLHHLKISIDMGFVPVVDMQNFTTKYNIKKKFYNTYNSWEYYFKPLSKYKLNEVYKSKNVIITDGKTRKIKFFDNFFSLTAAHKSLFNKYIKINSKILIKKKLFKNIHLKNIKYLGVHFRGSDMKFQERHPFPPTVKQITQKINFFLNKYNYQKIYLVTEELKYLKILKKLYGNKIIHYNSFKSNKTDIFKSNRFNHRARLGEENLIDMLLLKDSDRVICSKSHLSEASLYFNKKLKNKMHIIDNGFNSNNLLIAQFLWIIKNNIPRFFGGFN